MTDAERDLLDARIAELLADNDHMAQELWTKDRLIDILVERISELEDK